MPGLCRFSRTLALLLAALAPLQGDATLATAGDYETTFTKLFEANDTLPQGIVKLVTDIYNDNMQVSSQLPMGVSTLVLRGWGKQLPPRVMDVAAITDSYWYPGCQSDGGSIHGGFGGGFGGGYGGGFGSGSDLGSTPDQLAPPASFDAAPPPTAPPPCFTSPPPAPDGQPFTMLDTQYLYPYYEEVEPIPVVSLQKGQHLTFSFLAFSLFNFIDPMGPPSAVTFDRLSPSGLFQVPEGATLTLQSVTWLFNCAYLSNVLRALSSSTSAWPYSTVLTVPYRAVHFQNFTSLAQAVNGSSHPSVAGGQIQWLDATLTCRGNGSAVLPVAAAVVTDASQLGAAALEAAVANMTSGTLFLSVAADVALPGGGSWQPVAIPTRVQLVLKGDPLRTTTLDFATLQSAWYTSGFGASGGYSISDEMWYWDSLTKTAIQINAEQVVQLYDLTLVNLPHSAQPTNGSDWLSVSMQSFGIDRISSNLPTPQLILKRCTLVVPDQELAFLKRALWSLNDSSPTAAALSTLFTVSNTHLPTPGSTDGQLQVTQLDMGSQVRLSNCTLLSASRYSALPGARALLPQSLVWPPELLHGDADRAAQWGPLGLSFAPGLQGALSLLGSTCGPLPGKSPVMSITSPDDQSVPPVESAATSETSTIRISSGGPQAPASECIVAGYPQQLGGGRTFSNLQGAMGRVEVLRPITLRNLVLYNLAPGGMYPLAAGGSGGSPAAPQLSGADAAWTNSSLPLWFFRVVREASPMLVLDNVTLVVSEVEWRALAAVMLTPEGQRRRQLAQRVTKQAWLTRRLKRAGAVSRRLMQGDTNSPPPLPPPASPISSDAARAAFLAYAAVSQVSSYDYASGVLVLDVAQHYGWTGTNVTVTYKMPPDVPSNATLLAYPPLVLPYQDLADKPPPPPPTASPPRLGSGIPHGILGGNRITAPPPLILSMPPPSQNPLPPKLTLTAHDGRHAWVAPVASSISAFFGILSLLLLAALVSTRVTAKRRAAAAAAAAVAAAAAAAPPAAEAPTLPAGKGAAADGGSGSTIWHTSATSSGRTGVLAVVNAAHGGSGAGYVPVCDSDKEGRDAVDVSAVAEFSGAGVPRDSADKTAASTLSTGRNLSAAEANHRAVALVLTAATAAKEFQCCQQQQLQQKVQDMGDCGTHEMDGTARIEPMQPRTTPSHGVDSPAPNRSTTESFLQELMAYYRDLRDSAEGSISQLQEAPNLLACIAAAEEKDGTAGGFVELLKGARGRGRACAAPREMRHVIDALKAELRDPDLQVISVVGSGAFGVVYGGVWRGLPAAVKTLVVSDVTVGREGRDRHRAVLEAAISMSLAHPNIVATYTYDVKQLVQEPALSVMDFSESTALAVTVAVAPVGADGASRRASVHAGLSGFGSSEEGVDAFKLYIVQEYCNGGSLRQALEHGMAGSVRAGGLFQALALRLALDVACGMRHVHSCRIVHGDLKPDNVLLVHGPRAKLDDEAGAARPWGPGQPQQLCRKVAAAAATGVGDFAAAEVEDGGCTPLLQLTAKVADFGLSLPLPEGATHASNRFQGTPAYQAPEVAVGGQLSPCADVWSFGLLLLELYYGCTLADMGSLQAGAGVAAPGQQGGQGGSPGKLQSLQSTLVKDMLAVSAHRLYAELVAACLAVDAHSRPAFEDIVARLQQVLHETVC